MKRWNAGIRQADGDGQWVRTVGEVYRKYPEPAAEATASATHDPVRLTGYTHAELTEAFERVRDQDDWKGPIFAEIPATERRVVQKAIYWFTATVPVFATVPRSPERLIVTATGYRLGPAGH
jgi:hypothetical protein